MLTITEVYNNIPGREGLTPDWGFSCLINEAGLLFDTGAKGDVLVSNMRALDIDPASIRRLALSHDHWDHTGGLRAILTENPSMDVYIHDGFSKETLGVIREYTKPHVVEEWTKIANDIALTGPLGDGIREQSLAISTSGGYMIVTGCAHPHIGRIVARVAREGRVWGAMGGFHTVTVEDIDALAGMKYLSASHCTDKIEEIRGRYPEAFRPGGVGIVHRI